MAESFLKLIAALAAIVAISLLVYQCSPFARFEGAPDAVQMTPQMPQPPRE